MEKKESKKEDKRILHNHGVLSHPDRPVEGCEYCTTLKFPTGALHATKFALQSVNRVDIVLALHRHVHGDWGIVCRDDAEANEYALLHYLRIVSIYEDRNGIRFWIITEADRSSTTVLLPSDY